jgi:zinc protease
MPIARISAAMILLFLACSPGDTPKDQQPVTLVEFEKPGIPLVNIQVLVKSGSVDDPVGKEGLAHFTANLMMRGAGNRTREEIDLELQELGSEISVRVDRETILFNCQSLKENIARTYEIFSDILLRPTFPEQEVALLISEQIDDIDEIVRDDAELTLAVFQQTLYSGHRYAHPTSGLKSSVESFTFEDCDSFYQAHFDLNNIIIGIAGDYPDGFADSISSDFNILPVGSVEETRQPIAPVKGRMVVLVEKENRAQTHFRIGNIVEYGRNSSDYYPLMVAGAYLGQHRQAFGRLFRTVRSERGLAYGAYAYHEHFDQYSWSKMSELLIPWNPTYFSIWTYPKAVNAEFAIKLALLEWSKIIDGCVIESDLEKTKQFLVNHFPFIHETPVRRLSLEIEQVYFDDPQFLSDYGNRISGVISDDIRSAVSRHWSADDFLLVAVVSDGEKFKSELLDDTTFIEYPSGTTGDSLDTTDAEVRAYDPRLTADDITILKASDLFE